MTEVKKVTWSGVILAVAFVAGLAFMYNPVSALDSFFIVGPDHIHVGDTTTVRAFADDFDDGPGPGHARFTITESGSTGGAAVFTANGQSTLVCEDNDDGSLFPFLACDLDDDRESIEVEIVGTQPGVVQVCVEAYEATGEPTGGGEDQNGQCHLLTIEGSGGGILTITSNKASIGRPNEIGGWTGPGAPFNEFVLTAHLTNDQGTNVPGARIDFNTISPPAPNTLLLRDDEFDNYSKGGASCWTDSSGKCTVEGAADNSSEYGAHVIVGVTEGGPLEVDAGSTVTIIVAKPPSNVTWSQPNPFALGTATNSEIGITVTDEDGRIAWTGLSVGRDSGDGSFGNLVCPAGANINKMGEASCSFLSPGIPQTVILGVNIGGGLVSTIQVNVVQGGTQPTGTFNPVPVAGGLTITTYTGTLAALHADGEALDLVSCFATVGGNFIGEIFGAPAFVNQAFDTQFAGGLDEQGLICRRA